MSKNPNKFRDLSVGELRRSAVEDFAVDVNEDDNKDSVLAALTESGVKWSDYVAQHPEVAERSEVVTSADVAGDVSESLSVEAEPVVVRTAERPSYKPNEKLLIKMVRENPLYETRGYRFTQQHPYALVTPEDADYILTREEGFRQAVPSELQEYYG